MRLADWYELQRRSNVERILPNEASLLRLGTAFAIERHEQWLERRYLDPEELKLIIGYSACEISPN